MTNNKQIWRDYWVYFVYMELGVFIGWDSDFLPLGSVCALERLFDAEPAEEAAPPPPPPPLVDEGGGGGATLVRPEAVREGLVT